MNIVARQHVLVLGDREFDVHPFEIRGLVCKRTDVDRLGDVNELTSACAILVAESPGKLGQTRGLADGAARRAFEFGLVVGHWPADLPARRQAELFGAGIPQANQVHYQSPHESLKWIQIDASLEKLAEAFRSRVPGPPLGAAEILPRSSNERIPDDHRLLLRRAFHDASKLIVERLSGGKTADAAYRVFAELSGEERSPQPMPFVFKVATTMPDRDGWTNPLYRERYNYRHWAEPFIPFHLRPGLLEERCVTTPFQAAIACHFVDGATPLELVLANRQRSGLIFSLFETTLRGLRTHTMASPLGDDILRSFILDRVDAKRIRSEPELLPRIDYAKANGLSLEPEELEKTLANAAAGMATKWGLYHGDLHLGNVMARHGDAIVIDFGSMRNFGPITADPCALEASIVFGTLAQDAPGLQHEWRRFVNQLYRDPLEPPQLSVDHYHFAWINRAVRELRHVAYCCGAGRKEALLVLAASLLRYAHFSPAVFSDPAVQMISEERKAYAMVIAQQLCSEAQNCPS